MGVEPSSPQRPVHQKRVPEIQDYWPQYRHTSLFVIILMQLALTGVVALSLVFGGVNTNLLQFWVTILATLVTSISLNVILFSQLLQPHKDLITSLVHVAGIRSDDPLPNPNSRQNIASGLKPVLQFVYDRETRDHQSVPSESVPDVSSLSAGLTQTEAGIVILDEKGIVTYSNRSAPVESDTDGSLHLKLCFESDEFNTWVAHCRDTAVHAEKTWRRVPTGPTGTEGRRQFDIAAHYEKGSAAEIILVMIDSTDLYEPEDEELDFISFAAHELRGPITVIRGYLDVMDIELGEQLQGDQRQLLQRLIVSANRLSSYINNILNASKYDRRHLKIHLSEENLSSIYDSISDDMSLRASSQARLLSVNFPETLPTVAADRSSISEVISNLIDNAIKYSHEGGSISVWAEPEGATFVKISVKDDGIGIPGNVVGNLFHKFYRSHRSRETVAGSGIGLYICKAFVESHGGTIEVSSKEDQGSVFSFTLPTYASVAHTLQANEHSNAGLINTHVGWIKNHAKFKG